MKNLSTKYFQIKREIFLIIFIFEKFKKLYFKKKLTNSESMFLFRVINCSIFLERFA